MTNQVNTTTKQVNIVATTTVNQQTTNQQTVAPTVVHITPQNILTITPDQLNQAFATIPQAMLDKVFNKLSLNELLLIIGKIQYAKKNDELDQSSSQLKIYTDAIANINQETAVARQQANNNKSYTWPADMQNMCDALDAKLGRAAQLRTTKAADAVEALSNYSKQINDYASQTTATANQQRQDLTSFSETMSAILDSVNKAIKSSSQSLS